MHRRVSGGPVADAGKLGDSDAQVAVGAARQRFVEQPCFKQHAQSADQVTALDAGITHKEA